jgi:hypothetical protein
MPNLSILVTVEDGTLVNNGPSPADLALAQVMPDPGYPNFTVELRATGTEGPIVKLGAHWQNVPQSQINDLDTIELFGAGNAAGRIMVSGEDFEEVLSTYSLEEPPAANPHGRAKR